jgi:dTDP-4-dehydrorhamnose 3,5-epimerase
VKVTPTALPEVLLIEPRAFADSRGYFYESWHGARYHEAGVAEHFVQDNVSRSTQGVVRGLHFQHPDDQGKLVSVLRGEVFDVAVDIRIGSPTFSRWIGETLSADNRRQLYIPPGFAHGFMVTSPEAVFCYKCTAYYAAQSERTIRWDDPSIGIDWPSRDATLSPRDLAASSLNAMPPEHLPRYGA